MSVRRRVWLAVLIFFLLRIEQPSVVHRFLPRIVESQSCGAMDTTTSEATSIYHGRKVHEALVGKLTRKKTLIGTFLSTVSP